MGGRCACLRSQLLVTCGNCWGGLTRPSRVPSRDLSCSWRRLATSSSPALLALPFLASLCARPPAQPVAVRISGASATELLAGVTAAKTSQSVPLLLLCTGNCSNLSPLPHEVTSSCPEASCVASLLTATSVKHHRLRDMTSPLSISMRPKLSLASASSAMCC